MEVVMTARSSSPFSSPRSFTVPADEFRSLPIPGYDGAKIGTCFVKVTDLPPGLADFMKVNPRVPKRTAKGVLSGPVPKAILDTLRESPEEMALKNAGIYILAENVDHVREKGGAGVVTITLTSDSKQGIVNGGHSFAAIRESIETADGDQVRTLQQAFVRLHLLQGIPHEMVAEIAEGLNRSKQVQDPSLENLRGHFEEIKQVMAGHVGHDAIAYHEGADGDVYIAEILALIEMFNFSRYPKGEHPHGLYAHQARAVREFAEDIGDQPSSAGLVVKRLPEILKLADTIRRDAPPTARDRANFEIGRVKLHEGKKNRVASVEARLHFLGENTKYRLPNGWLYPMLAAFRANVAWDLKNSRFDWRVPNQEILKNCLPDLVSVCVNEHRNNNQKPEWVGKRDSAYRQCHLHVELYLAKQGKLS
jgi:AIPR protein